jgi:hypothetical protein
MAWTVPITFYDGDPLTAAQWNTFVRDNLNATAPGIATSPGNMIVTSGRNRIAERQWARSIISEGVLSSGEWPGDPDDDANPGPTLTFEHGGSFLMLYDVRIRRESGTGAVNYAPVIESGPGELPNVYNMAVRTTTSNYIRTGSHILVTGADAGITTVTMKYGATPASGGTSDSVGSYAQRRLTILPF